MLPVDSNDFLATPLDFGLQYSTQAILLTLILAVVAVLIPVALSLRTLPKNSIIVGSNSAAIAAQCQRPRGRPIGNYGTISNDGTIAGIGAVVVVGVEGGGEGEEGGGAAAGGGIEMHEIEAQREGEENVGEAEHNEQQDEEGGPSTVQMGNDEQEHDESRGSLHRSRLLDHSPSHSAPVNTPWLEKLQWGVLVSGSTSPKKPGQLGLAVRRDFIGAPIDEDYYQ